jgi:hypothetical protein
MGEKLSRRREDPGIWRERRRDGRGEGGKEGEREGGREGGKTYLQSGGLDPRRYSQRKGSHVYSLIPAGRGQGEGRREGEREGKGGKTVDKGMEEK